MSDRRSFVARVGALAAAFTLRPAAALAAPARQLAHAASPAAPWDLGWLDELEGDHRQVFDCGTLTDDEQPLHVVSNWLNAHQEVYGLAHPRVSTVVGIASNAFPINASSPLWARYGLGEQWKLHDSATGAWATRNIFYEPAADLPDTERGRMLADMTVTRLQSRGTVFWQCNNALRGIAQMLAQQTKQPPAAVYDELKAGLNPGVHLVPAHTMLIGLAQEHGCTYEKI